VRCVAHIYNIAIQASKHSTLLAINKLAFKLLAPLSIFVRRARNSNANSSITVDPAQKRQKKVILATTSYDFNTSN